MGFSFNQFSVFPFILPVFFFHLLQTYFLTCNLYIEEIYLPVNKQQKYKERETHI